MIEELLPAFIALGIIWLLVISPSFRKAGLIFAVLIGSFQWLPVAGRWLADDPFGIKQLQHQQASYEAQQAAQKAKLAATQEEAAREAEARAFMDEQVRKAKADPANKKREAELAAKYPWITGPAEVKK